MEKQPIYTIGHGTRKIEDFIQLLKNFEIKYLIDARSRPYSRFNPQYNQEALKNSLEKEGITYVFMGDTLGGRPTDTTCYDSKGKIDYEQVKTKDFFIKGIERLKTAYDKNLPISLMCSESKPGECHRSKLIGIVLSENDIPVQHIDEKGKLKTQVEVIKELHNYSSGNTLFSGE